MYEHDIDSAAGLLSPSPFSPTTQKYLNEHENDSHHHHHPHHPYTHHQNPSPTNDKRHSLYSLSKSSSSSLFSSSTSIIHTDAHNDPSTNAADIQEKNDSFLGIFKNLISKAKKGSQYLFDISSRDENEKHNEIGEVERVGHIGRQKSHNDLKMNHLPTSTLPNNKNNHYHNHNNNKDKNNNNISVLTRPPLYNHSFPFISNEDLFDSKIISPCSVRKKDNIYEENSSKFGFLYQKEEFLRTLIYSPTGISPLETTFPSHFEYFSPQSPSFPVGVNSGEEEDPKKRKDSIGEKKKGEDLKFVSEEMKNEKEHLIHTLHMSKSSHYPHFNPQHSNSFQNLQQQSQHQEVTNNNNTSSTIITHNPEMDAKTHQTNTNACKHINHDSTKEEKPSDSSSQLHQIKSFSTSDISNDKNHPKDAKNTTTDESQNVSSNTNKNTDKKNINMNFKAKSKIFIPYPIQSGSSSVNSSNTSLTSNENSDDHISSAEDIKHIQNCSCDRCNYRNMMKTLGRKNNKIPSLSPSKSSHDKKHPHHHNHSTSRNKINIFDTLFYETYQNNNNKNNNNNGQDQNNADKMTTATTTTNSTPMSSIFKDNHCIMTTLIINSPMEDKKFQFPHNNLFTTNLFNNNKDHQREEKEVHENENGKNVLKEVKEDEKEKNEDEKEKNEDEKEKNEEENKKESNSLDSSAQSINFTKYYNNIMNNWQLNHLDFNATTNLGIGRPKFDREDSLQKEIHEAFTSQ